MPFAAWSLAGFLSERDALAYFQQACVMPNKTPGALRVHYQQAKKRLGNGAIPHPGRVDIQDIPGVHQAYLDGIPNNPRFNSTIQRRRVWAFKLVEIEPLLAWQIHVLTNKVKGTLSLVGKPPSIDEMLAICLPHTLEIASFELPVLENGIFVVRSDDLNLRPQDPTIFADAASQLIVAGPTFGVSSNLIQVGIIGGRCVLHNGYHRATALRMAGATHIPCIVFEADMLGEVVALGKGLPAQVLSAANPPTVGHFTRGLGHDVQVRKLKKEIELSFSILEREVFDE